MDQPGQIELQDKNVNTSQLTPPAYSAPQPVSPFGAPYPPPAAGQPQGFGAPYPPAGQPPFGAPYPPPGQGPAYNPYPPPGQPGAFPQQQYGMGMASNTTVVVGQQPQPQPTRTVVVTEGNCPACRSGMMVERFTICGILMACIFFPIGLICCLMMRRRVCTNCGAGG